MVDARDELLAAGELVLHAQLLEQGLGADLHAVAQAHGLDPGVAQHVPGEHGHGVGVVQEQGVRANLLHVPGKVRHDGNGAQGAHDAPDAQGVADGLAQAVLLGHLKVDDGAGVVQAHLNGVDDEVRPPQGVLAVFHPQVALDFAIAALGLAHGLQDGLALLEPLPVDVVQGKGAVPQLGHAHAVANDVAGKDGTARAHKGNLHRKGTSSACFFVISNYQKSPENNIAFCGENLL